MILLILSILLSYILLPIGFIYSFFKLIFKGGFRKQCIMIAVSIDQLNNKVCKELFNDTLITKDGYGFGKVDETISSALGRNILKNTISATGRIFLCV